MEDSHIIYTKSDWGYFGVFDGHGGDQCSKYVSPHMTEFLDKNGKPRDDQAVKDMILQIDADFLATQQGSGSTATMCMVHPPSTPGDTYKLHVINAGDSRVLLGRADGSIVSGGDHCTDQGLTVDHKPDHPSERERIFRCGGYVEQAAGGVARVNGDLAVSRGFGDAEYKKTGGPGPEARPVTANPEQGHYECQESDFLMLVCDGVSEGNFPNPEVVALAAQVLRETNDPGAASSAVIHKALAANSKDNITCMIVQFSPTLLETKQTVEFVPGPMTAPDNAGFMTCWKAMAEKANLTSAQAAEMRYDYVEQQLNMGQANPSVLEELREEKAQFGVPAGAAKDSAERRQAFEKLGTGASRGGGGSELDFMRQMMGQPGGRDALNQLLNQQQEEPDNGRKVKAASLAGLKAAVEAHSALEWDERMEALAGSEGTVKTDDASDGTTQVRFPAPIGMVAWLPTSTLQDL
jgi:serine/threonine protein phosphatase PrpC